MTRLEALQAAGGVRAGDGGPLVKYLLRLPVRMARAAVAVPLGDLDAALALSAATRYVETWADSFAALAAQKEPHL